MANIINFIGRSFSLIPGWLSAIFIALCVYLICYLVLSIFDSNKENITTKRSNSKSAKVSSAEFDTLLQSVLASKDKNNSQSYVPEKDIEIQQAVPTDVVAVISAVVQQKAPNTRITTIEVM